MITPPTKITYNLPPTYLSLNLSPKYPPPITPIKEPMAVIKPMRVPIAHAEGRFLFNDDLEAEILKNNLITYKYCDSRGNLSDDFPTNPNGSLHSAAALSNPTGNVMAIMPHPERTLKNEADDLFDSMKN